MEKTFSFSDSFSKKAINSGSEYFELGTQFTVLGVGDSAVNNSKDSYFVLKCKVGETTSDLFAGTLLKSRLGRYVSDGKVADVTELRRPNGSFVNFFRETLKKYNGKTYGEAATALNKAFAGLKVKVSSADLYIDVDNKTHQLRSFDIIK